MPVRYYTNKNKPLAQRDLIKYDFFTWFRWMGDDKGWVEHRDACGIMAGEGDWAWYETITAKEAFAIMKAMTMASV